jgi:hypothetical protein
MPSSSTLDVSALGDGSAVEHLTGILPGDEKAHTDRRERLEALLEREADPGAVEVFRAWFGPDELPTIDETYERIDLGVTGEFDPAGDRPKTSDRIRVVQAYEKAVEQEIDDAAAYIRVLDGDRQRQFSTLLLRVYLN